MTFPFVTRSLYDSRTTGLKAIIADKAAQVTAWANANLELEKTITQLKNRLANLNNSYDMESNHLSNAQTQIANLKNALNEANTATAVLLTENQKLKAKCLKTSSKPKKKD